jgi:hypothetical protein
MAGQQYLRYVANMRNFTQRNKYKLHGFKIKGLKKGFRRRTMGKSEDLK